MNETTGAFSDVTDLVADQHVQIARMLEAILQGSGTARRGQFEALGAMLDAHESAEQRVIYPVLRELGERGVTTADERIMEEQAASAVLTDLRALDTDSVEFEELFRTFSADVRQHAHSEETEVLAALRDSVSEEDRQAMYEAFMDAEVEVSTAPE